jgi:transposase
MSKFIIYVGLDVHAESIVAAVAEAGGEVRNQGSFSSDLHSVDKFLARLRKAHPDAELRFCYEAGPTGFVLARHFHRKKLACIVVAPSLIPTKSGDRIKTDRRDAAKLARLFRAGELTGINIPDAIDEAMRDLCRARTDAVQDQRRQRAQLKAFLLRHGYRYSGKTSWNDTHLSYLRGLTLSHPAHRAVLEDTLQTLDAAQQRIARLEESMEALLADWHMKPVVAALMGMRGFALVGAMVIVSELGGAWRFEHPRQLMAYLGLVPTESSSGTKRRLGSISKTGNCHARWIMIEASHHYRLEPGISPQLSKRQEGLSEDVKACAWKAQTRLHKRMNQLLARGKQRNKVQVAVARELTGFIWQMFQIMSKKMDRTVTKKRAKESENAGITRADEPKEVSKTKSGRVVKVVKLSRAI